MLANFILKNAVETNDEDKWDDESIESPQRARKRMVSLLETKANAQRQEYEDESSFEDGEQKSSFIKGLNLTQTPTSTPEKEKKILPPSKKKRGRPKKIPSPVDLDDVDLSAQIDSIISVNDPINLTVCTDKECGCKAVHCPFCDVTQIKPSTYARMRDHLEMKHFNHGIQFEDLLIMKCAKTCGGKTVLHYHCPFCKGATFMKRTATFRHLLTHAQKMGKGASVIKLPDLKLPSSVFINGQEVKLCKKICGDVKDPHYHCPKCHRQQEDRKSIICHMWRCQTDSVKNDSPYTSTYRPVNIEFLKKAYQPNPSVKTKIPKPHVSIVRSLSDLPHDKCQEDKCCGKKIHCALCYKDRFSPCFPQKLKRHYYCHWRRRIPFKGYWVLPCYLDCQVKEKDSNMSQIICHFHCPICGSTRRRREYFYNHLEICQGGNKPYPRPIGASSLDFKFEEVDPLMDEELNDTLLENSEDFGNEFEQSMEQSDVEEEVDMENMAIFGNVTAQITRQLLSLTKSVGVFDIIFHEVAENTGTKYLVSPGTICQVHCLQGTMQNVNKAMEMIQMRLSIGKGKNNSSSEIETDQEVSKKKAVEISTQEGIPEETNLDKTSKQSEQATRSSTRKRPGSKVTPVPAKKIKEEPKDVEETPVRKYSTRGIKMNFASLSTGGGKTKSDIPAKSDAKTPGKDNLDKSTTKGKGKGKKDSSVEEEIMIITDKNEKFKLKLPSDMVATIKEKLESNQGEKISNMVDVDDQEDDIGEENFDEDNRSFDGAFHDSKGQPITSGSIEYYVRKYKMSTSAIIPEVTMNYGNSTKKRKNSNGAPRRVCRVQNKYRCSKCDFACSDFNECTKHLKEVHEAVQKYRCDVCERHFEKESYLRMHLDAKHGPHLEMKEYKCDLCDRVYTSHYNYQKHTDRHTDRKFRRYACRNCDFVGEDRIDLESHVKEKHFIDEAICSECGKFFKSIVSLTQHMDNVHRRKNEVACPHCPKIFANPRYLRLHMDVHTGEKKHECPICGQKFRKKGNMVAHEQTHLDKEERSYRYICSVCGLKCLNKGVLLQHMNKHTGERPYSCDICKKTFSFISAMKKHKVFCHSTENPFECQICDKRFKAQRLLDEHMIVHTGISDHQCDVCKKVFTTAGSLKNHKKICKGLVSLTPTPTKIIVYNPPNISTNTTSLLASGQDQQNIENVIKFHLQNQGSENLAENETVIIESGYTAQQVGETFQVTQSQQEVAVDSIQQTQTETEETAAASDVQVYMCSECNMAFNDYTVAEQHVLQGHETTTTVDQTDGIAEQKEETMMIVDSAEESVNLLLNQ